MSVNLKTDLEDFVRDLCGDPTVTIPDMPKSELRKNFRALTAKYDLVAINNVRQSLTKIGLTADEVIDVDVRAGTDWLYALLPDADFVLVDPQAEGAAMLEHTPARFTFLNVAAGAQAGTLTLYD